MPREVVFSAPVSILWTDPGFDFDFDTIYIECCIYRI